MESTSGTWLCPTELDRTRLLDMEQRLQRARTVLFGSLGVAAAICIPWVGPWLLILAAVQVTLYAALKPFIHTSARPEYPVALVVTSAQVLIAVGVAVSGAAGSPVLPVFLLGIVALPARFGTNGVIAGVLLTELLIFGSTAGVDPAGFAANPSHVILTGATTFGFASFAHALMQAELQKRSESVVDSLTGLPNRRGMESRFDELRAAAVLNRSDFALLLCDLDLFKSINDVHGHQRGDLVLSEAADAMRSCLRQTELVYRIGGEEFLVLLPGCDLQRALPVAERIRRAVESAQPGGLGVTVSLGAAAAAGEQIDFNELFREADQALYEAKRMGRNRVAAGS